VLCFGWSALATLALLWPGLGQSNPDSQLPTGFAGQRLQFELSQFIPLAIFFGLGVLFYILGTPTRRAQVDVSLSAPLTPPEPAAGD
jgi:glutamate:GABA antiporter